MITPTYPFMILRLFWYSRLYLILVKSIESYSKGESMSGKRRRYESSWDMKQDKIPPPESNDSRRPSWEGNRKVPRYDDISRDNKHRTFDGEWGKQHTTYRFVFVFCFFVFSYHSSL